MPFMDYRLVNYVFSLPADCKLGNGYTKLILRLAMKGMLPDALRLRTTKIGFNSPLPEWLTVRLAPWVEQTLNSPSAADSMVSVPNLRTYYEKQVRTGLSSWNDTLTFWKHVNLVRLMSIMR
jgi:asparagine synthase (glutamine-hydrolysing)